MVHPRPSRFPRPWRLTRPARIRTVFEDAGFVKAADTTAVSGGFPRVLMRLDLR
jgi:hypothetical protein